MIYVTHDQIEALTLADRIAVMQDQAIQQLGTPAEIYHRPANRFVAGFVGSPRMNFLEGRVEKDGGELVFSSDQLRLPLNGYPFVTPPATGLSVSLGIRPEHVQIGGDGPCRIDGLTVDMIEPMGADSLLWFRDDNVSIGVRLSGETSLKEGETPPLTVPVEQLSIFSSETGARL
jgi:multiple sugar transport system ATP-binding protein